MYNFKVCVLLYTQETFNFVCVCTQLVQQRVKKLKFNVMSSFVFVYETFI